MSLEGYKNFERKRLIGEFYVTLPEPPEDPASIANYGLPIEEQKFKPIAAPTDAEYDSWTDAEQDKFFLSELAKVHNGYWFYNKGNLEYITGVHYFYLSYWKLKKIGLPSFRDLDRDFFYAWDHSVKDLNSYGLAYIAKRREGKTSKFGCILYIDTILNREVHTGIQSKTGEDAKGIFTEFIVDTWKKLPKYWKPTDSGETNPLTSLKFFEASKKGKSEKSYKEVINSFIDHKTTVVSAYDGKQLFRWGLDEFGKITLLSAFELFEQTKPCLTNGNGRALLTTTVEEMEKFGGKYAKEIWDGSDCRDPSKWTTDLYRLFFPAYYGLDTGRPGQCFIDEWGYSDVDAAKAFLEGKRAKLKGSSLAGEKRKYPFTIQEAFRIDKDSVFDTARIYDQLEHNANLHNQLVRGNLQWEDINKPFGRVKFVHNENGRWLIYKMPANEDRNKWKYIGSYMAPANVDKFSSGCDPVDHHKVYSNKESHAASFVYRNFDGFDKQNTDIFVASYYARPPKIEDFFLDMAMQCIFFGTELLCESNKAGLINYFIFNGLKKYLTIRPDIMDPDKEQYGIPMTGEAPRSLLIRSIQTWVYDNLGHQEETDPNGNVIKEWMGNCQFDDLLMELPEFDVEDWTIYDRSVAAGLTLIAKSKTLIKKKKVPEKKPVPVKIYSTRGVISKRIYPK